MASKTTQSPKERAKQVPAAKQKTTASGSKSGKVVEPPKAKPSPPAAAASKKPATASGGAGRTAPAARKGVTPPGESKGKKVEGEKNLSKSISKETTAAKTAKPQAAKPEPKQTAKAEPKQVAKAEPKQPVKAEPKQAVKAAEKAPEKAVAKVAAPKAAPKAVVSLEKTAPEPVKHLEKSPTLMALELGGEIRPSNKPCKALPREFLVELATAIRDAVHPHVREARGREIVGSAVSGDATFALDKVAEKALLLFLKGAKLPVAYYSEDAGYTTFTNAQPQNLLIIDPIDGTRAAKSGFESCVVSVASSRVIERPCMADVDNACIMEISGTRTFYAEKGKGVRITMDDHAKRPKLSHNANLETLVWSMTVPARPADLVFPTAARLIDISSLKGGFFACNSTSYSLTRLLTNQLDAAVDVGNRFLRDIPSLVRDHFINAGRGVPMGIAPYDIAASLLIAREAGCIVTDAYGKSLDHALLLDSSPENHLSMIAAANIELHTKLMKFFETRIQQVEEAWRRKAEAAARAQQAAAAIK
jgi:myo-inositol-1(or 4)-monophosphatase